jgi:CheY-like chemotaxis protein
MISHVPPPLRADLTRKPPGKLAERRFLVVEDEPLVALDIADDLEETGAEVVASTGSAREALERIQSEVLDAVLLDANLHGSPADEVAAALTRRKMPFLFVTVYRREKPPPRLQECRRSFQALQCAAAYGGGCAPDRTTRRRGAFAGQLARTPTRLVLALIPDGRGGWQCPVGARPRARHRAGA